MLQYRKRRGGHYRWRCSLLAARNGNLTSSVSEAKWNQLSVSEIAWSLFIQHTERWPLPSVMWLYTTSSTLAETPKGDFKCTLAQVGVIHSAAASTSHMYSLAASVHWLTEWWRSMQNNLKGFLQQLATTLSHSMTDYICISDKIAVITEESVFRVTVRLD